MTIWEYKIEALRRMKARGDPDSHDSVVKDRHSAENDLNREGATGWELVNVQPAGNEWLATFKRPKE